MNRYYMTEIDSELVMLLQFEVNMLPYVIDITDECLYYEDQRGYTASYTVNCLVADLTSEISNNPGIFNSETIEQYLKGGADSVAK
jgi:hypothetical protein